MTVLEMYKIELAIAKFRPDFIAQILAVVGSKWPQCNGQPPPAEMLEGLCRLLLEDAHRTGKTVRRHEICATYLDGEFSLMCVIRQSDSSLVEVCDPDDDADQLIRFLRAIVHQNGGRLSVSPEALAAMDRDGKLHMNSRETEGGDIIFELIPEGEDEAEHNHGGGRGDDGP